MLAQVHEEKFKSNLFDLGLYFQSSAEPNKWKIRHQSELCKSLVPFEFFLNVTLVRDVVKISIVGEINDLVCIVTMALLV